MSFGHKSCSLCKNYEVKSEDFPCKDCNKEYNKKNFKKKIRKEGDFE